MHRNKLNYSSSSSSSSGSSSSSSSGLAVVELLGAFVAFPLRSGSSLSILVVFGAIDVDVKLVAFTGSPSVELEDAPKISSTKVFTFAQTLLKNPSASLANSETFLASTSEEFEGVSLASSSGYSSIVGTD